MNKIFLSYTRKDEKLVSELYQNLKNAGYKPWMDTNDILPGEKWDYVIKKEIRNSDFIIICLSKNSVDKRGYIQKEIKKALDISQEMLDSDIFLIPVRLEDCDIPDNLQEFQVVNLFEKDGLGKLIKAINEGSKRIINK